MNAAERIAYDDALDAALEHPEDCPVCWNGAGAPCSEECGAILERAAKRRVLKIKTGRLYRAAHAAFRLARRYQKETSPVRPTDDPRVRDIVLAVRDYRKVIRTLRRAA